MCTACLFSPVEELHNNLLDNKTFLWSCYRTGAMSSNYLSCYPLICRRKTLRPRTSSNFTDLHAIYKVSSDHSSWNTRRGGYRRSGYIYMQTTIEAVFYSVTGRYVRFYCHTRVVRIFSWDCQIIPQSNSPMPVLPTMQSDDVRQENMATVNIA